MYMKDEFGNPIKQTNIKDETQSTSFFSPKVIPELETKTVNFFQLPVLVTSSLTLPRYTNITTHKVIWVGRNIGSSSSPIPD